MVISILHVKQRSSNLKVLYHTAKKFSTILRTLTQEYYLSRYPDASEDVPYKIYHKDEVERYLIFSEEVIIWVEQQLKK